MGCDSFYCTCGVWLTTGMGGSMHSHKCPSKEAKKAAVPPDASDEMSRLRDELELVTKHAKEGWDLAARLRGEWKSANDKNVEMIPVVLAAISFWNSDKGDTESQKKLFEAVESFEGKEGNDIVMWHIEQKRKVAP